MNYAFIADRWDTGGEDTETEDKEGSFKWV